jgi:hypothetical protein
MNSNIFSASAHVEELAARSDCAISRELPAIYFIRKFDLRCLGVADADEVLVRFRDGPFESDWLAMKDAASEPSESKAASETTRQGTWIRLTVWFPGFQVASANDCARPFRIDCAPVPVRCSGVAKRPFCQRGTCLNLELGGPAHHTMTTDKTTSGKTN